jgi:hypothetical protein
MHLLKETRIFRIGSLVVASSSYPTPSLYANSGALYDSWLIYMVAPLYSWPQRCPPTREGVLLTEMETFNPFNRDPMQGGATPLLQHHAPNLPREFVLLQLSCSRV